MAHLLYQEFNLHALAMQIAFFLQYLDTPYLRRSSGLSVSPKGTRRPGLSSGRQRSLNNRSATSHIHADRRIALTGLPW